MTKIQLKDMCKEFGVFTAIENINLSIESGELIALLGPSGCGKTTTLRIVAGLETPTRGKVLFDGQDVSNLPVQNRNVGMVFQGYALFPHMTVEKNIAFGLSVRKILKDEIEERLAEILDVVQLSEFRYRFPSQLSGGQMQRVAIARTLITKPSILMMDEPLSSLDTKLRSEMRRFIRDLQQRVGITTIFVTHDQVEAMELADRIAVILNGRLVQYDTPDTLYQRPLTTDVADFMGANNVFPAQLDANDCAKAEFGILKIVSQDGLQAGDNVNVMLRDEAIDILDRPDQANHQTLAGKIIARDFFGANVTYTVVCGETIILASEQSRRFLDVGRDVWLDISPEHVWLMPR